MNRHWNRQLSIAIITITTFLVAVIGYCMITRSQINRQRILQEQIAQRIMSQTEGKVTTSFYVTESPGRLALQIDGLPVYSTLRAGLKSPEGRDYVGKKHITPGQAVSISVTSLRGSVVETSTTATTDSVCLIDIGARCDDTTASVIPYSSGFGFI